MGDLGFLINEMCNLEFHLNETPIALSGRMVGAAQALVLCGSSGFLFKETPTAEWLRGPHSRGTSGPRVCIVQALEL